MKNIELYEELGGGWDIAPEMVTQETVDLAEEIWAGGSWDFLAEAAVTELPLFEDELSELGRAFELKEDELEEATWFEQAALEHGWCPYVGYIDEIEAEIMSKECMALADGR
ncbi:MAG: hypothetical protein HY687_00200 [Chloroflexi bacterium]|nr:hypothetical protein [Chloroflexota bacterium]